MSARSGLDAFPGHALEPEAAELYRQNFDAQLCVLLSIAVSLRKSVCLPQAPASPSGDLAFGLPAGGQSPAVEPDGSIPSPERDPQPGSAEGRA